MQPPFFFSLSYNMHYIPNTYFSNHIIIPDSAHVVCALYIQLLKPSARMEVVCFLLILHIEKLYSLLPISRLLLLWNVVVYSLDLVVPNTFRKLKLWDMWFLQALKGLRDPFGSQYVIIHNILQTPKGAFGGQHPKSKDFTFVAICLYLHIF